MHSLVEDGLAQELQGLASREPPSDQWLEAPVHADRYLFLLAGHHLRWGPAFAFPTDLAEDDGVTVVHDVAQLDEAFDGWTSEELVGRSPVLGVVQEGRVVSICFCARRSEVAAEAGLETAPGHRGRGFGPRVTAAWARAIRDSGRTPIYSTWWKNDASMAVARKLGLQTFAVDWGLTAPG